MALQPTAMCERSGLDLASVNGKWRSKGTRCQRASELTVSVVDACVRRCILQCEETGRNGKKERWKQQKLTIAAIPGYQRNQCQTVERVHHARALWVCSWLPQAFSASGCETRNAASPNCNVLALWRETQTHKTGACRHASLRTKHVSVCSRLVVVSTFTPLQWFFMCSQTSARFVLLPSNLIGYGL